MFSVFITIFTNEPKMKIFWHNLFQSYQLTPRNCHRLSHLMLAIFAPITYPAFEVLNLIKYTRRKLQLNEFLQNEKDLGRFRIPFETFRKGPFLVLPVGQSLPSFLWKILKCPCKDLELPFSKQPRRLQNRVIDYFDSFTSYKNARTKKGFLIDIG